MVISPILVVIVPWSTLFWVISMAEIEVLNNNVERMDKVNNIIAKPLGNFSFSFGDNSKKEEEI